MTTGFQQIDNQLWISKDPQAQLFYTFNWADWLPTGDTVSSAVYTVATRVNDPTPLVKVSNGIQSGNKTYIELRAGQTGKSYLVTVKVTTAGGLVDARNFKVKIEARSI
jgi:hypothetical protein